MGAKLSYTKVVHGVEVEYRLMPNGTYCPVPILAKSEEELRMIAGRFGTMRLDYLKENYPERFMDLQMAGLLEEDLLRVDQEAEDMLHQMFQAHQAQPAPKVPRTFLENYQHHQSARDRIEEMIIKEIVEVVRL